MADGKSSRIRIAAFVLIAAILLAAAAVIARPYLFRSEMRTPPPNSTSLDDDPRLTFDTPFLNVRPEVKYVGDAACADCHKTIARHYARHPMGRSMALASDQAALEPRGPQAHNPFEQFGDFYSVVVREGKVYHRDERRDAAGKAMAASECEARYAVGSGTRGKSYLVDRDGRLFMSPVSWYAEKRIWDISPGFGGDVRFNYPITAECLFCHCNRAETIDGPINSYKTPVFNGIHIGCERCHGPGELHVRARESGQEVSKPDYTLVNPRHLELRLRDAVCEQCHLQGEQRILARGRQPFDYRPGLPLFKFWSIHVPRPELEATYRSVGQVAQMHLSNCWKASLGKLGCISCHDPHERPAEERRVEFYRGRCLNCHDTHGCKVDLAARKRQQPDDSCIACHMSKDGSSNIPHTAVTDHRILRRPESLIKKSPTELRPGESPIVNFHAEDRHFARSNADRDLGIALVGAARGDPVSTRALAVLSLPLLEQATREQPHDAPAWEALAKVLEAQDRLPDALQACEMALEQKPSFESALVLAGGLAKRLGRTEAAIDYWKRAIEINPYVPHYHVSLAAMRIERREWAQAESACAAALTLEPFNIDARVRLITCLVHTGQSERATAEFKKLMALHPRNESELRAWFEGLSRS
jgi:Tetratricopeptide repeat